MKIESEQQLSILSRPLKRNQYYQVKNGRIFQILDSKKNASSIRSVVKSMLDLKKELDKQASEPVILQDSTYFYLPRLEKNFNQLIKRLEKKKLDHIKRLEYVPTAEEYMNPKNQVTMKTFMSSIRRIFYAVISFFLGTKDYKIDAYNHVIKQLKEAKESIEKTNFNSETDRADSEAKVKKMLMQNKATIKTFKLNGKKKTFVLLPPQDPKPTDSIRSDQSVLSALQNDTSAVVVNDSNTIFGQKAPTEERFTENPTAANSTEKKKLSSKVVETPKQVDSPKKPQSFFAPITKENGSSFIDQMISSWQQENQALPVPSFAGA